MRTIQRPGKDAPTIRLADKGALPTIRLATIAGMLATAALLGVVSVTAGLGVAGWIAGLVTGSAAAALLVTARMRSDQPAILPADWVTLTRMVLIAGVAGLVADSFGRPVSTTALVTLSSVALALDAVDGLVARWTGTATPLGARIDGEADAFLILLLSIVVSQDYGAWVLAIGAARYALLLAGWLIPWLAAPLPPRFWRKVVAAVQGIVLTVAASGVPSRLAGMIAVAVALLLLAESFGRDVIWLYRTGAGPRTRRTVRITVLVLALGLLWFDLVAPDRSWEFSLGAFVRIPVEALVLVAIALVLPLWPRRIVATIAGLLLSVLTLDKILNIAVWEELNRPFNPLNDWGSIRPAAGVVRDAIGTALTNVVLVVIWVGIALLVVAITAATIHVTAVAARHRRGALRGLIAVTAVWALSAGLSLQATAGAPVASTSAAGLAVSQVHAFQAALSDPRRFTEATRSPDPEAAIPASDLLTGLRGKDVLIVFVESYGQVAVRGSSFSPGVDAVLAPAERHADPRRLVHAERLGSPPRPSAVSAGSPTPPCSQGCGSTATSAITSSSPASGSPSATPSKRPGGTRSPTTRPTTRTGSPARSFTTTTSSTTRTTLATAARNSATPRCPTSTPLPRSSGTSSSPATSP